MKLTTAEEGALIAFAVLGLGLLAIGVLWGAVQLLEYAFSAN